MLVRLWRSGLKDRIKVMPGRHKWILSRHTTGRLGNRVFVHRLILWAIFQIATTFFDAIQGFRPRIPFVRAFGALLAGPYTKVDKDAGLGVRLRFGVRFR